MSREVECGKVAYKSSLILSVMVYVKQMHENCFSLVSKCFGITRKFGTDEMKQKREKDSSFLAVLSSGYLWPFIG